MQFTATYLAAMALTAGSVSAQPGGVFFATQDFFSSGGCTGIRDSEATFGAVNTCQEVPTVLGSVTSVLTTSVEAGCTVHYYTNAECTEGDTVGAVGQCRQASKPFVATNVICP